MRRFVSFSTALVVLAASLPAVAFAGSALEPPSAGGLAVVDRALFKLAGHRRLLVVGAHPDDEDNALLSYASRALGAEVAYLSLSRGEGGQNLIGTELGTGLGVVRTGELLAARGIEDGRQFFTRAYDFGYTRSLDETFSRWPRRVLREDAVRVARRFKPQVVVSVFPASERARHGQHHASAVIARDVFELAGDPDFRPELAQEGLEPWAPTVLYRRSWGLEEATLSYSLAGLDPLTGRSWAQIAAASRSQHRSQDMGRAQRIGTFRSGLVWIAGGVGIDASGVFDGVDTRLAAIAAALAEGPQRQRLAAVLEEVEALAIETRRALAPAALAEAIPAIARLVTLVDEARALAESSGSAAAVELIDEKRALAASALQAAAGILVDARVDREEIPVGGSAELELEIWAPAGRLRVEGVAVRSARGWSISEVTGHEPDDTEVQRWQATVTVSPEAAPSVPYFLERPLAGDLYRWDDVPAAVLGEPFEPPPMVAVFDLDVAGARITAECEIVHRYADQALGEVRRPVRAVPAIEVEVDSSSLLWLRGSTRRARIGVVVRSNLDEPVAGVLHTEAPEGWVVESDRRFEIVEPHGSVALPLELVATGVPVAGRFGLEVEAKAAGTIAGASYPLIEYSHTRPRPVPVAARLEVTVLDLQLPPVKRVGYVLGASDRVPSVLGSIGVPVTVLSPEDLRLGDLSVYDTIVIGSRAYETDRALQGSNGRLLDYVARGGALLVQYQQYQFVDGGFAPFELSIDRPHGRVTDETAPVEVLEPDHPLLSYPNAIVEADWTGWVQERGLYFPGSFDERYRPLLTMGDAGRQQERGALLVAAYGEGTYIYTGLSFFRQLPAGVPGALRLFSNLLAAGRRR